MLRKSWPKKTDASDISMIFKSCIIMYHNYSQLATDKLCFAEAFPKAACPKIKSKSDLNFRWKVESGKNKVQGSDPTSRCPVLSKLDSFADFFAEGEKQVHGTSTRFFFLEEEGLAKSSLEI